MLLGSSQTFDFYSTVALPLGSLLTLFILLRYIASSLVSASSSSTKTSSNIPHRNDSNISIINMGLHKLRKVFSVFPTLLNSIRVADPATKQRRYLFITLVAILVSPYFIFVVLASYSEFVWFAPTLDSLVIESKISEPNRRNNEIPANVPVGRAAFQPCFALGFLPFVIVCASLVVFIGLRCVDFLRSSNNNTINNKVTLLSAIFTSPPQISSSSSSSSYLSLEMSIKVFAASFGFSIVLGAVIIVISLSRYNLLCSYSASEFRTLCDEAEEFLYDAENALKGVEDEIFNTKILPFAKSNPWKNLYEGETDLRQSYLEKWKKTVRVPDYPRNDIPLPQRFVNVVKTQKTRQDAVVTTLSHNGHSDDELAFLHEKKVNNEEHDRYYYEYSYTRTNQTKKIWLHNSNLLASMRKIDRDNNFFIKNDHDFDLCMERAFFPKLVEYLRSNKKYFFTYFENHNEQHYLRRIPRKLRIFSRDLSRLYAGHSGTWMIDVDECYYGKEPLRENELGCNGHQTFTLPSVRDTLAYLESDYPESNWQVPKVYNNYIACYFFPNM